MRIRDLLGVCKLAAFTLIAWLLPPRLWRRAAIATCALGPGAAPSGDFRQFLGDDRSEADIARIDARHHAFTRELQFQILGLNGPWRSWRPNIHLSGVALLQAALDRGHGAILWDSATAFSTLMLKMALHDAGINARQLSRRGHGFFPSAFANRFLNPIWLRTEGRFIAERVVIEGDSTKEAVATVRKRLAANGVVIITVVPQAHRLVEVPFLRGRLRLPSGPIRLARETGASLLPVFTNAKPDGGYDVAIDRPLYPADGSDEGIAAAYAKRLEPFVEAYPEQWNGWTWYGGPAPRTADAGGNLVNA